MDFKAPDGRLVTRIWVILVPAEGSADDHLQLLATVAEACSDESLRAHLDGGTDRRPMPPGRCASWTNNGTRREAAFPTGTALSAVDYANVRTRGKRYHRLHGRTVTRCRADRGRATRIRRFVRRRAGVGRLERA